MTLAQQILDDADVVFLAMDDFALTVTYTTLAGVSKSIKAVFRPHEELLSRPFDDGQWMDRTAMLYINTDATLGIASPAEGDQVTVDNAVWRVEGGAARSGGLHRLTIVRRTRREASPNDYRIER